MNTKAVLIFVGALFAGSVLGYSYIAYKGVQAANSGS
jgi:hypothetical protein